VRIPNEVKLMFADCLNLHDINSLMRTSRAENGLLTPYMYRLAKDLESTRRYRGPYVFEAVDAGNLTAVRHFIEVGTSVNMSDTLERLRPTALQSCVQDGNIEIVRLLIEHGVNMSAIYLFGWTPLHYAVSRMYYGESWAICETWVRLLVDAGADISATAKYSRTILYAATMYGITSIFELLLQRGAIPTV
jgi:ankyrin repeat protein